MRCCVVTGPRAAHKSNYGVAFALWLRDCSHSGRPFIGREGVPLRNFNDQHDGDLALSDDLRLNGQVRGNVTVPGGFKLDCYGQIAGDLIVERGATATVFGTVAGKIQNKGGMVHLHGVAGAIEDVGPTKTMIEPTAVLLGGKR